MANKNITRRRVMQIIQLHVRGISKKSISIYTGMSRTTVKKYLLLFSKQRLTWDEVKNLNAGDFDSLFGKESRPKAEPPERFNNLVSFLSKAEELLQAPNSTLFVIWVNYLSSYPNGYRFSQFCRYFSSPEYREIHKTPLVALAPLPSSAQFLNVIESVFSGLAKAIIHSSDYQSVQECKAAIDEYFATRNMHFIENPKRAGNKIWGKELVKPIFNDANNCKDPKWR